jgi:hypothetical protein
MKRQKNIISDVIIEFIQKQRWRRFSLNGLLEKTGLKRLYVIRVLDKFHDEGYLELIEENFIRPNWKETGPNRRNPTFRCIKDLSLRKPNRAKNRRDKIWRTLRYLKKATRSDITRLTGCTHGIVVSYTVLLSKYNYIKAVGKRGQEKVWILVQDVGPKRPILKEK